MESSSQTWPNDIPTEVVIVNNAQHIIIIVSAWSPIISAVHWRYQCIVEAVLDFKLKAVRRRGKYVDVT
jgi:hypothetical protein